MSSSDIFWLISCSSELGGLLFGFSGLLLFSQSLAFCLVFRSLLFITNSLDCSIHFGLVFCERLSEFLWFGLHEVQNHVDETSLLS